MNASEGLDVLRMRWRRAASNREDRDRLAVVGNALRLVADVFPGLTVLDVDAPAKRTRRPS